MGLNNVRARIEYELRSLKNELEMENEIRKLKNRNMLVDVDQLKTLVIQDVKLDEITKQLDKIKSNI